MQTIKGLIALVLVAVAALTAVIIYNNKTEPAFIAKVHYATMTNSIDYAKKAAPQEANRAVARQKTKKANL